MAKTKHGLPETKGVFQIVGKTFGTVKDGFFIEKKTKTKKDWRAVNFGVEYNNKKSLYLNLNGMPRDLVYFSGKVDKKNVVEKVKWDLKDTYKKEGFNLIGVRLGLEKGEDKKNIKKTLTDFDACKEIADKMKDEMSIFTKGKIEFSSFFDNNGEKRRSTKLVPGQISLTSKEVDFDAEGFEPKSDFNQVIVFMGIEKNADKTATVSAKIVTYDSIEDAEFLIEDTKLASMFAKNLKPYTSIKVHGHIKVSESVSEVEETDTWGESDPTQSISAPTKIDFVISGATPATIDTEEYTEAKLKEAISKLDQTEDANSDWGTETETTEEDDDDEDW